MVLKLQSGHNFLTDNYRRGEGASFNKNGGEVTLLILCTLKEITSHTEQYLVILSSKLMFLKTK